MLAAAALAFAGCADEVSETVTPPAADAEMDSVMTGDDVINSTLEEAFEADDDAMTEGEVLTDDAL